MIRYLHELEAVLDDARNKVQELPDDSRHAIGQIIMETQLPLFRAMQLIEENCPDEADPLITEAEQGIDRIKGLLRFHKRRVMEEDSVA